MKLVGELAGGSFLVEFNRSEFEFFGRIASAVPVARVSDPCLRMHVPEPRATGKRGTEARGTGKRGNPPRPSGTPPVEGNGRSAGRSPAPRGGKRKAGPFVCRNPQDLRRQKTCPCGEKFTDLTRTNSHKFHSPACKAKFGKRA